MKVQLQGESGPSGSVFIRFVVPPATIPLVPVTSLSQASEGYSLGIGFSQEVSPSCQLRKPSLELGEKSHCRLGQGKIRLQKPSQLLGSSHSQKRSDAVCKDTTSDAALMPLLVSFHWRKRKSHGGSQPLSPSLWERLFAFRSPPSLLMN